MKRKENDVCPQCHQILPSKVKQQQPAILDGLPSVSRMSRDIAAAGATLSPDEARFLVDAYYQHQGNRLRADNQVRALSRSEEPCDVLLWLTAEAGVLEKQIGRALDKFSEAQALGQWARSIVGVGPVISAGLLAHIDIDRVNSAGQIWSFAGLSPSAVWEKGKKRPWNADLKTLCWKLGESFVKTQGFSDSYYGPLFAERKRVEWLANANGANAAVAKAKLEKFKIGKDTDAYAWYSGEWAHVPKYGTVLSDAGISDTHANGAFKRGVAFPMLPPAHIHARARRYAVKLFLSHYFEVGYYLLHGKRAPDPWVIVHGGHKDYLEPPNAPWSR